jgi:hypothetical protein
MGVSDIMLGVQQSSVTLQGCQQGTRGNPSEAIANNCPVGRRIDAGDPATRIGR